MRSILTLLVIFVVFYKGVNSLFKIDDDDDEKKHKGDKRYQISKSM